MEPRSSGISRGWYLLIALLILFSYANQLIFRYQVPPGGDAINHNQIVLAILAGHYQDVLNYHSLWHLIVALISKLTTVRSITVMAWLGPSLLVSGSLILFFFNRKYFGIYAGVTSLILLGFFSRQPLQTLYDGGFPNVLAATTVLPLVFMALERCLAGDKRWSAISLFLVSLIFLLYSHHLTLLYAGAIIGLFLFVQLLLWLGRCRWSWWQVALIALATYGLALLAVNAFLHIQVGSAHGLASQFLKVNWQWPFLHLVGQLDNPNAILDLSAYPNAIGEALVYLSLGGVVVSVIYFLRGSATPRGRIAVLLLIWLTVLLIGSQTPAVGFPVRLARDAAIPMALLGGAFIQGIADFYRARQLPRFLLWLTIIFSFSLGWQTLFGRTRDLFTPNPLVAHLAADSAMAKEITAHIPDRSTIVMFSGDIYLPLFVAKPMVISQLSEANKQKITDPGQVPLVVPTAQYVYFSYRLDQPTNWDNNRANLDSYRKAANMTLVLEAKQKEEEVYLFRVNPTVAQPLKKKLKTTIK